MLLPIDMAGYFQSMRKRDKEENSTSDYVQLEFKESPLKSNSIFQSVPINLEETTEKNDASETSERKESASTDMSQTPKRTSLFQRYASANIKTATKRNDSTDKSQTSKGATSFQQCASDNVGTATVKIASTDKLQTSKRPSMFQRYTSTNTETARKKNDFTDKSQTRKEAASFQQCASDDVGTATKKIASSDKLQTSKRTSLFQRYAPDNTETARKKDDFTDKSQTRKGTASFQQCASDDVGTATKKIASADKSQTLKRPSWFQRYASANTETRSKKNDVTEQDERNGEKNNLQRQICREASKSGHFYRSYVQRPYSGCIGLRGVKTQEPKETIFLKPSSHGRSDYSAKNLLNINERFQLQNKSSMPTNSEIYYNVKSIPDSIYETRPCKKNAEIYKRTSQDYLKQFLNDYVKK